MKHVLILLLLIPLISYSQRVVVVYGDTSWITNHYASKENVISSGISSQFWAGDKVFRGFDSTARKSISLTTTGSSGAATYNNSTGILNIPNYSGGGGSGTVTTLSIATANGISGSVANATTTPAITLSLGAITPSSVNGVSSTTIGYLDATSSVQTQIDFKLNKSDSISGGYYPYATNPKSYLTSYTETDPIVKAINGIVKSNGTTISAAIAGTDYLTPSGSAAALTSFPTLNQNTTGSAATLTTPRNIQGISFNGSSNIDIINGTGFVKSSGTVLSYDNSNYITFKQSLSNSFLKL